MKMMWNDRLLSVEECRISPEDRGYQFGDGIYEVISVYDGNLFQLDRHLNRLQHSADQIMMPLPLPIPEIKQKLIRLVQENGVQYGQIYMQITRGYAPRSHAIPSKVSPELIAYPMYHPRPVKEQEKGAPAVTAEDIRWLRCDIKSLNLLGNILTKQVAVEKGARETILHREGIVTEGSSSNVFIVKGGQLITRRADNLILNGITRSLVIELAEQENIPLFEGSFTVDELKSADEVFITSTIQEILPITKVDEKEIGSGQPGPITKRLQERFRSLISQVGGCDSE